ncbi:GNAT family N-acetyltransferase [Mucilaginibacter sp. UR6-11]|uniref:GNAT family N-acetyltransferase n=1 Tax=Mucilaginibacter sp. UR6-11 TaxID=1435644 RepID=UPI001E587566|nr:GNAT family N-acetyltransferase [Mucilaginibacter sp. UR6-11]MCC8426359.1 aminoacyltransferase [Mucilaginibacter sp. UR6-11]
MEAIDSKLIVNFKDAFLKFLSDGNYVSVFIRMNPFYNQYLLLNKIADVYENGKVVVMDLNGSIEDQRRKYNRTTLANVKSAINKGYYIKEENSAAAIKVFKEIYDENMKRIGAAGFYLFDEHYYLEMLNTTEYDARLFMAYKGDEVACSTIVVFKNEIIQSYLIGTRAEYLCDSPAKFLADGIGKIGRESGMRYFNLGGGLGFQKDSLFNWKSSFSDLFFDYRSWRYIANPTVYQHLLDQRGIDKDSKVDFFPLYRLA